MPTYSIQDLKNLVIQNYPDQYLGLIGPPEERQVLNAIIDYLQQVQSSIDFSSFIYNPETTYNTDDLVVYQDFWYRSLVDDNTGNTPLLSGTSAFWTKLSVASNELTYWAAGIYLANPALVLYPVLGSYDIFILDRTTIGLNPFDSINFNDEYLAGLWKPITGKYVRFDVDNQGLSPTQKANARKNIGIEVHNDLPGIMGSPDGIHLSQSEYDNLFLDFDTELIDGGLVQWSLVGFTFFVSPIIYKILGDILQIIFSSTITLDPSYVSNDRTDALYVDADKVVKIRKGEDIPASPQPQIDPLTEVLITYINVPAGSTEPIITDLVMYAENVEYTVSFVGTGTGVSNSTDAPHGGSVSIKYTAVQNNGTVRLTGAGDEDLTDFVTLGFWIKLIAAMNAGHSITAQFFDSAGVAATNELVLPIVKSILDYQFIALNISSFTIASNDFRRLDFKFKRTSGPSSFAGFYLDDVKLETGVTQPTPGTDGEDGWSPILAVVSDGARRVLRVTDWTGGQGTKPATGLYVGATGLVVSVGDGVDIRGSAGVDGAPGADGSDGAPGTDGADGAPGADGTDGREVEIQNSGTFIQWRYVGDVSWNDIVSISALTGPAGANGTNGTNGTDGADGAPGTDGADGADGREIELQVNGSDMLQWRYVGDPGWTDLFDFSGLGGGGGHVIKTEGTPLTQRAGLNFSDKFIVTDDSGDDETDVDIDTNIIATRAYVDGGSGVFNVASRLYLYNNY